MTITLAIRSVFVLLLSVFLASCGSENYCQTLKERASKSEFQTYIFAWIEKNLQPNEINAENFGVSGKGGPGILYLKTDSFDWGVLGFNPHKSNLKLVGIGSVEDLTELKAIYLGETSNYGILVKLSKDKRLDFDKSFTHGLNSRISVFCFDGG